MTMAKTVKRLKSAKSDALAIKKLTDKGKRMKLNIRVDLQSKASEGFQSVLERAASRTADITAGVGGDAVKVVVVLGLEDEGGQPT